MNQKFYDILRLLSIEEYQTAHSLAKKLGLSEKTVRTRLKQLKIILGDYGAELIIKKHYGYRLLVCDAQKFVQITPTLNTENLPETMEERQQFLLRLILEADDYIKLDDLSQQLFFSRNTISATIKRVEESINSYDLSIERRPNYGIRLVGSEFNIRTCIVNNLSDDTDKLLKDWVIQVILKGNHLSQVEMSEIALESFVSYVIVCISRVKSEHKIALGDLGQQEISFATQKIIDGYADQIESHLGVCLDGNERRFLAIHFSSKLSSDSYSQYGPNFVISSKIDELVYKMLRRVEETFSVNFGNNLELRMSLNQHMVPMDIRLRYNIPNRNPLLEDIKQEYPYPYTLAIAACLCLQDYYHRVIPEDEVAYIALIFALATEKRNRIIEKKNIILVCVSGKSSSQLFKFKYKQAFGNTSTPFITVQ